MVGIVDLVFGLICKYLDVAFVVPTALECEEAGYTAYRTIDRVAGTERAVEDRGF